MSDSSRFTQELRDRLTLSEVIGKRVRLVRAGHEYKGCCPFHREKSPSFYVNDEKQFYHCFGCGAHGDVFGFVMQHDNLSFPEAQELLAAQAGMEVPRHSHQDKEHFQKQKDLYSLCDETAKWFEAQLYDGKNRDVLNYIKERGLSDDTLNAFRIGYAPNDDQALRNHLSKQGYNDSQMIEAGVLKKSTQAGRPPYAFFRDRVIFPVADGRGRVVAFGGRVLPEHMRPPQRSDFKPPKYINSADTPLFHKGRTLYAGQHARLAAKEHKLIVVEGYMDAIACHQAGFRGAVAPLGTALTEEQIALLWKMIPLDDKEPVLCFDGDEAGYRAALRAAERVMPLLKPHYSVRIAFLPAGEDPDTYIRENGTQSFSKLIASAHPLIDFLFMHYSAGKNWNTPEARAGLSAQLEELAAHIPDGQLQFHYKSMFREKLRNLFGQNWSKNSFQKKNNPVVALPAVSRQKSDSLIPQLMLLTIINHPEIYPFVADDFHRLHLDDPDLEALYHAVHDILDERAGDEEDAIGHNELMNGVEEAGLNGIMQSLLGRQTHYIHAGFARLEAGQEQALEGWKSLWKQWNIKKLAVDIHAARAALIKEMTPENESRMLALKQEVDDLGK